jgi:hypothetical protein
MFDRNDAGRNFLIYVNESIIELNKGKNTITFVRSVWLSHIMIKGSFTEITILKTRHIDS